MGYMWRGQCRAQLAALDAQAAVVPGCAAGVERWAQEGTALPIMTLLAEGHAANFCICLAAGVCGG